MFDHSRDPAGFRLLVILVALCARCLAASSDRASETPADSPDGLACSVSAFGVGLRVANEETHPGRIDVRGTGFSRPIAFELGRDNSHLRRVTISKSGDRLSISAGASSAYAVYESDCFVGSVVRELYSADAGSLTAREKIRLLVSTSGCELAGERRSTLLRMHALQAVLGVEFTASMEYPSEEGGDYRVYAGGDFRVRLLAKNSGEEALTDLRFGLVVPDEWQSRSVISPAADELRPGGIAESVYSMRASGRSLVRAPVFPLIATMTFRVDGRACTIHYPFGVRLSDPFAATLTINSANERTIKARIRLRSVYPGREMKSISMYPWLSTALTVAPSQRTTGMSFGQGGFRLDYVALPTSSTYRAVTVVMKLDEHLVRLRSVMEATLDVGTTIRGPALWLDGTDDRRTVVAEIGGRRCRKIVGDLVGTIRYVNFGASPNFPWVGRTWVSVTYYDYRVGRLVVEPGYVTGKEPGLRSAQAIRLEGTGEWKTTVFSLDEAERENRLSTGFGFRLAVDCDLNVSRIVLSKFAPETAIH